MTDTITAGSILVAGGMHLPGSLVPRSGSDSNGWAPIQDTRAAFEKTIQEAGWTFFFMAGEIRATVFGFDRQKSLRVALQRLIADVKSQHCNSIEIAQVTSKSFLNIPYVSVFAHVRHLQKGLLFRGRNNGK
jgi:hypothetical protein